jgi:hypothetical protein
LEIAKFKYPKYPPAWLFSERVTLREPRVFGPESVWGEGQKLLLSGKKAVTLEDEDEAKMKNRYWYCFSNLFLPRGQK